jgi:spermidine/putrescine transport system substrate-binding protein
MNGKSFDSDNPYLRAALLRGLVSRRSAMMGAAGVSAAAFLAACGSAGKNPTTGGGGGGATGTTPAKTAAAAQDVSDSEKVVNWSNWTEYIDVSEDEKSRPTLEAFTKKTGIKVNYTEDYLDNDEFYAKVRPLLEGGQDTGRDLWVSTDWMVARLIRQGYIQKLDLANIPNARNLEPTFQNAEFDPGRQHSLPWQAGFACIGYNTKATGGKKVESMTQLLTDPALKGKVTLLTEMRDTVGLVLLDQGKDPANFTDADFEAAIDMIQQAKDSGQLKGFTGNEYTDGLSKGDIAACVAWSGDVASLRLDTPELGLTLPSAGYTIWTDNLVIPALAKHKKNAEKLIDYYYDPEVFKDVAAWVNYIPPVAGTKEALVADDPELGNNTLVFPTEEVLAKAHVFRPLNAAEETKYTKLFSALTTA